MIEPLDGWHPFASEEETLSYLREHQLVGKTATEPKPLYYRGSDLSDLYLCQVVGYADIMAVISVNGSLHCIHPDYLKDMQPSKTELATQGPARAPVQASLADTSCPASGKVVMRSVDRYTVIDLETTGLNCTQDEIIELAAIRVRKGQISDTFSSLVQCEGCLPAMITSITGIAQTDLSEAPKLEDILPAFLDFLGRDILVGHNVAFDVGFLSQACQQLLGRSVSNDMIDTIRFCRKRMKLDSYRLSAVREALGLPEHTAHRALSDCETTMEVYEALKQIKPSAPGKKSTVSSARFRAAPLERHPELYPTDIITGEESPFWGAVCVLTGELHISREEAAAMIETAGGTIKSAVSRKTNYLIVGQQDKSLVGEDGLSSKEEKAIALNESGKAHIQMISEEQLCAMLSKEGAPCG